MTTPSEPTSEAPAPGAVDDGTPAVVVAPEADGAAPVDGDELPPAPAGSEAAPGDAPPELTPEQKAAADVLAAMTPEERATKEAADAEATKTAADAAIAEQAAKLEITTPEGFTALDEAALAPAKTILAKLGVTDSAVAQDAVNAFAKDVLPPLVEKAIAAHQGEMERSQVKVVRDWNAATIADPEISGGSPETLQANLALVAKARDQFGTPALLEFLNGPVGHHPEVVRFMMHVGAAISEGSFHQGASGGGRKLEAHQKMYGEAWQKKS